MRRLFSATLFGLAALGFSASVGAQTIGVSLASDDNPFYIAMLRGVNARAAELGWKVSVVQANEDVAKQVNGVSDLIAKKVNGILISPIDEVATCSGYDAAKAQKIPMVSIARSSKCPSQTLHLAMNEVQVGRDIAKWTAEKLGGKGKIAMIAGPAGAGTFINLSNGYQEVMKGFPDIQIVYKREVLLQRENGLKQAEDILVAHSDIAAIYGANDEIALGAAQAVKTAGKAGKVAVTGMNGIPPALRAVKAGDVAMTVEINPVAWGRLGVDTLDAMLKGRSFEQKVYITHQIIDAANIDASLARLPPAPPR